MSKAEGCVLGPIYIAESCRMQTSYVRSTALFNVLSEFKLANETPDCLSVALV